MTGIRRRLSAAVEGRPRRYPQGAFLEYSVMGAGSFPDGERFLRFIQVCLANRLGILGIDVDRKIAALLPGLRKNYGVLVAARGGDSAYSGDELQPGDVIYSANTTPVTDVASLRKALDGLKDTDPLVLQVERDGGLLYLTLEIE